MRPQPRRQFRPLLPTARRMAQTARRAKTAKTQAPKPGKKSFDTCSSCSAIESRPPETRRRLERRRLEQRRLEKVAVSIDAQKKTSSSRASFTSQRLKQSNGATFTKKAAPLLVGAFCAALRQARRYPIMLREPLIFRSFSKFLKEPLWPRFRFSMLAPCSGHIRSIRRI